jgi:hypothetical protein
MEAHPAADLFPMMSEAELRNLADDIKANGLNHPVVIYEGQVLDGRNRSRACKMAGVQVKTEDWVDPGCGPVAYVVSQNIHRRHLTATQRAALAVDLLPELEAEARKRQGRRTDLEPNIPEKVPGGFESRQAAAELVQVNERYISDANKIGASSPELLKQMRSGEISLRDAQREAKRVVQANEAADPEKWTEREVSMRREMESGKAVVVNLKTDGRLIGWAEGQGRMMRVDRGSEWGNPFLLGADGDRNAVCDSYRDHYLPNKPSLLGSIKSLRGKALGCWCSPERCHADELAGRANAS